MATSQKVEVVSTITAEANGGSIATNAAAFADDAAVTNQTDLCPEVEVELVWAHASAPVDGDRIDVFAIAKPDGTNEVDAVAAVPPASAFICSIPARAVTSSQRQRGTGPAPPFSFRGWLLNRTGQTISAGWVLKIKTIRRQIT